jgi:hypothetical protein
VHLNACIVELVKLNRKKRVLIFKRGLDDSKGLSQCKQVISHLVRRFWVSIGSGKKNQTFLIKLNLFNPFWCYLQKYLLLQDWIQVKRAVCNNCMIYYRIKFHQTL